MKEALASAAEQGPAALAAISDQQTTTTKQPLAIRHGVNGWAA